MSFIYHDDNFEQMLIPITVSRGNEPGASTLAVRTCRRKEGDSRSSVLAVYGSASSAVLHPCGQRLIPIRFIEEIKICLTFSWTFRTTIQST
jgi:hypothetical protein